MDDLINRYGIPYNKMLHDLTILKMQHMVNLSITNNDNNDNNNRSDYNMKLISCYYETIADLNDDLNDYKETHDF